MHTMFKSKNILQNENLFAKMGFDTAENEASKAISFDKPHISNSKDVEMY